MNRILIFLLLIVSVNVYATDYNYLVNDVVEQFSQSIKESEISIKKIAVYSITTNNSSRVDSNSIQDKIVEKLLSIGKFKVLDRTSLNKLLKEQALSQTGAVDEKEMVKAGKIIGIDGFFFGHIEVKNNKIVFTIKLIEVESSMLLYSKTFEAEDYSLIKAGAGIAYSRGTQFKATRTYFDTRGGNTKLSTNIDKPQTMTAPKLSISYVQGFKKSKYFRVGAEVAYSHYEFKDSKHNENVIFNIGDGINGPLTDTSWTELGSISSYNNLDNVIFIPSIYIGLSKLKIPVENIFLRLGVMVNIYTFNNQIDFYSSDGESGTANQSIDFSSINPLIGLSFDFVKHLEISTNASYQIKDINQSTNISGGWLSEQQDITFTKGLIVNGGISLTF